MAKGGAKILFGLFFFVVLVAGLSGGGAWYLTEHRTAGYQATALLLIEPGTVTDAPVSAPVDGLRAQVQGALGLGATASLAVPDYATLFSSDTIAQSVQQVLSASGDPAAISVTEVRAAMNAETTVALQTSSSVVYEQVIQLHFTTPDPALSARGADAWADACVAFAATLDDGAHNTRSAAIQEQFAALQAELAAAREQQTRLREASPLEPLELAVRATSEAIESLKQTARQAQADAARGDAALKALKAYVAKAPPAVVLELSMAEATAEAETAGARAESEFLTAQLAGAEAEAAAARTAWAQSVRDHEAVEETIARLVPRVAALENGALSLGEPGPRVRVAAKAVAPETPIGPHRYIIVAGAAVLGAIAGMIIYFGLLTLRVYARELDRT